MKEYYYKGWVIHGVGGFCTVRHFWANKGNLSHWGFKLKDCKVLCDRRDKGEEIDSLYLEPLYQ